MRSPRLHVAQGLSAGASIVIEGERAHYLRSVMRVRVGQEVRLFNGDEGEWGGRIADLKRHRIALRLAEQLRPPAPEPGATLAFAPIRMNRLDWLVEKAVELGVARLVPVLTRRTVVRLEKADRLRAIAIEAAEQCERLSVPAIDTPLTLSEWLSARDSSVCLLHADERAGAVPALTAWRRWPEAEFLVGPEGGFADDERTRLREEPRVTSVSLGPIILRAETAALFALAAWQIARHD
jgi:16S rRNA (uracil1498-N3)-methyltransferase